MFKWIHHLLNPHCEHCQLEREDAAICKSCEVLMHELELMRNERDKLLDKLLINPSEKDKLINDKEPVNTGNKFIPTIVRRQMLETEDRAKARALKNAPKPETIEVLETELGINEENELTAS